MTIWSEVPEYKIENLPKCISIPLKKTFDEENSVRRLHLLLYSYKQIIHFTSICFICDYLNSNILNVEIDQFLGGLKKPLLGYWVKISQTLPGLLSKYKELFIPEWVDSLIKIESKRYENCISYDLGTPKSSLTGLEAFLRLRNSLSHGALPPDEKLSESIYYHYLPILIDIIDNIQFFNNFKLFFQPQVSSYNNEKIGSQISLLRLSDEFSLELYPLVIHTSSINCYRSSTESETFLIYESIKGNVAYYVGVEEKYEVKDNIQDINTLLFEREKLCISFWKKSFFELIKKNTLKNISSSKFFKSSHIVYQERIKYTSVLKDFIYNTNKKKTCLLFVSESGVGKTSLICDFFLSQMSHNDSSPLPLLIFAANLSQVNTIHVAYENGSLGQLGNHIKELLNFGELISDWPLLVQAIESKIQNKLKHYLPQLVLCLDGINEAPNPFQLIQEFDYVVKLARNVPWLTCIGTIRKTSFEILLAKLEDWGIQWPQSSRSYIQDNYAQTNLTVGFSLEQFSEHESYLAYQKYQEISVSETRVPASISSYHSLSMAIKQMIRHPLILEFLMYTYNHRNIPSNLAPSDLYDEFHNFYLDTYQSKVITKLAANSSILKKSDFSFPEFSDVIDNLDAKNNNNKFISAHDLLQYYLDLGVITHKDEIHYKFTYQLYFEYLIFKDYFNSNLSIKKIADKVIDIFENTDLYIEEEINATQLLLLSKINDKDEEVISSLILLSGHKLFTKYFTPLIYEIKNIDTDLYSNITKSVLECSDKNILINFYQIYRTICDRNSQAQILNLLLKLENDKNKIADIELKRVRLLIAMNQNDEAKLCMNVLKTYAEELKCQKLLLDIYSEEAYFDFLQGSSVSSLTAYEKANILLIQLKSIFDDEEFLKRQRDIHSGIGCSQHNLDDNEACLNSHSKSLSIDRQLDNKSSIALDLVNIADALWGCHNYGKALSTYDEAIEISKKTCYQDALNVALIGRGMVLWSVGLFQDGLDSIDSGLEISSQISHSWDMAYGLLYKSNIQSSLKINKSVQVNKEASLLAQKFGAEYLTALSNAYLFWKYEIRQAGLISNLDRINKVLLKCQSLRMHGVEIMILTVKILNKTMRIEVSDSNLNNDINLLLSKLNNNSRIKGVWERMALKLIQVVKATRPNIDLTDFIDVVDEICEFKANSLDSIYKSIYIDSLKYNIGL